MPSVLSLSAICTSKLNRHPRSPRSPLLPVSVACSSTRSSSTSRAGGWSPSRTSPSTKSSSRDISRRAADARRADARIAVAGGGDPAAAARGRAAERARLSARRQRREVPAAGGARAIGCGSKSRSGGGAARSRARRRRRLSAIRSSPKRELLLGLVPDRTRDRSDRRSSHPRAQIGDGHDDRPARHDRRRTYASARNCRIGASAVIDGWTEIGDDTEIYPFASIGLMPQDLKFRGEETRLVDRQAQHLPRVRHDPPRHARRRRRDDDRRSQRVHGLRARGARLPRRQRHDLRQHGDARRPRRRSRTSPTSAPDPASTSSAASGGTRSSAAIRW